MKWRGPRPRHPGAYFKISELCAQPNKAIGEVQMAIRGEDQGSDGKYRIRCYLLEPFAVNQKVVGTVTLQAADLGADLNHDQ